jgi:hypothetical protein
MNGRVFEYTGYIESINIKGRDTSTSHQFLFSVMTPDGTKHWPFRLDWDTGPVRYAAMASLLTAAFASDKIVRINTAGPSSGDVPYATEIEVVRDKK